MLAAFVCGGLLVGCGFGLRLWMFGFVIFGCVVLALLVCLFNDVCCLVLVFIVVRWL